VSSSVSLFRCQQFGKKNTLRQQNPVKSGKTQFKTSLAIQKAMAPFEKCDCPLMEHLVLYRVCFGSSQLAARFL